MVERYSETESWKHHHELMESELREAAKDQEWIDFLVEARDRHLLAAEEHRQLMHCILQDENDRLQPPLL